MVEINLTKLADAYRMRPMSNSARSRAEMSAEGCRGVMLDVGGGRGWHAATWAGEGRVPVVVDPSSAMLSMAKRREGVSVVGAISQSLPFRENVASLVYMHLSIHYGVWSAALSEAVRVTARGGRVEIWTIDPTAVKNSSLSTWFPRVAEIDQERFPDPDDLAGFLEMRCRSVALSSMNEPIQRRAGEWADAVRARFVSTLQLLDDTELEAGLCRFTEAYPDPEEPYNYELSLVRISATV